MSSFVNLVLVCLDGDFNKSISKELAEKLDMFFADLSSFIEYDLVDSKAILQKCGIDYLNEREFSAARSFAHFENAVLTVDYDLFKQNRAAFDKSSFIVYLRLPQKSIDKKESLNILSFNTRDEYLLKNCNLVVALKNKIKSKATKEILINLKEAL